MKSDRNIFLLKIALVVITLVVFAREFGHRDILHLSGVLSTISMVFAVDIVKHFTKRSVSHALEVAYLLFILMAQVIGINLGAYDYWPAYDKVTHFASGVLTVFIIHEFFAKEISRQRPLVNFLFYLGVAALAALTWETFEFSMDQIFGTSMQRVLELGIRDTMIDVLVALAGAVLAWIFLHRRRPRRA